MELHVYRTKAEMGLQAALCGAAALREAIAERGAANLVVATGASQFEMLAALVEQPGIDWHKVTGFHLDEYVGLPVSHPGSFRLYLWQRFVSRLPVPIRGFHWIDAEGDCRRECARLGRMIDAHPIDVAMVGIGENGHLAFNDPPADFDASDPYLVVDLDEACRRQQLGEGWFESMATVPRQAISMSVRQILKSRKIVCTVPDARKADAVRNAVEGEVSPLAPASILQTHPKVSLFLDEAAAAQLKAAVPV